MNSIRIVFFAFTIFLLNPSAAIAIKTDYSDVRGERCDATIKAATADIPELEDRLKEDLQKDSLVYIFLPGILGSELHHPDGTVLWGEATLRELLSTDERISLNTTPNITPKVLYDFDFFLYKKDVYGAFIKAMEETFCFDKDKSIYFFPYDWRKSISSIAKSLNEVLTGNGGNDERAEAARAKIKGKRVVFLAHSMGGVVLNYWYHKYYNNRIINRKGIPQYLFKDIELITFLGAPLHGSPTALYRLAKGFTLKGHVDSIFGAFQRRTIVKHLNKYALTFQGIFDLLPYYNAPVIGSGSTKDEFCSSYIYGKLGMDISKKEKSEDTKKLERTVFNPGWWTTNDLLYTKREYPNEFKEQEFKGRINRALEFRKEMHSFPLIDKKDVHYYATRERKTMAGVQIDSAGHVKEIMCDYSGDETVPYRSAHILSHIPETFDANDVEYKLPRIYRSHMELMSDPKFIERIGERAKTLTIETIIQFRAGNRYTKEEVEKIEEAASKSGLVAPYPARLGDDHNKAIETHRRIARFNRRSYELMDRLLPNRLADEQELQKHLYRQVRNLDNPPRGLLMAVASLAPGTQDALGALNRLNLSVQEEFIRTQEEMSKSGGEIDDLTALRAEQSKTDLLTIFNAQKEALIAASRYSGGWLMTSSVTDSAEDVLGKSLNNMSVTATLLGDEKATQTLSELSVRVGNNSFSADRLRGFGQQIPAFEGLAGFDRKFVTTIPTDIKLPQNRSGPM